MNKTQAYAAFARIGLMTAMRHRLDMFARVLAPTIQIYLLVGLWSIGYGTRSSMDGVARSALMCYLTVITLQSWCLQPVAHYEIAGRIREGAIALDLLRPIPFPGQVVARQAGASLGRLPALMLAIPLSMFAGGLNAPASASRAVLYLASLTLAYAIAVLLSLLLGLASFWLTETSGIMFAYMSVSAFLSGGFVPLELMPTWLRHLFQALPFQASGYTPSAIYAGLIPADGIAAAIAIQAMWILVLAGLASLLWHRGRRVVVLHGG